MQWRVHVGVSEPSPDHLQDGTEIASGYALSRRPDHVRRDDGPVIVPEVEAGQGGFPPPPQKKKLTPPLTPR